MKPCEGYGASETSPVVSVNHMEHPRDINSVGKILDTVKVKIVDDEILVGGPTVMYGYWDNPIATQKALVIIDGEKWYKTGDSGIVHNDFLYFKGRNSDNYKLSNGKFVDVHKVETSIKPYVNGNFIVWGSNMDANVLISDIHISQDTINKINNELESHMRICKSILVETKHFEDSMTTKLSLKRRELIHKIEHLL